MKILIILTILIAAFSINGLSQGLLKSVSNMQSETAEKVKQMLMQNDSERNSGAKTSSKNYAAFKPSPSDNLKNIANEMGKTAEEKAAFLQLFTEVKKLFETEAADKKNNVAGAATFLMATAVSVYHQAPEPSKAATDKLFDGLNSMYDEIPQMASASSKDKQFLYDLYISYGGLILASYEEAKETKNRESIDAIRVIAGAALLDFFQINPTTIHFEGDSLRMKSESGGNSENNQSKPVQPTSRSHTFAKQTTNFTDTGWVSTVMDDYVSVTRNGVEVRLYYADQELDNAIPKNTQYPDYYWSKLVAPYFTVSNPEKFVSMRYYAYLIHGEAVEKQSGKKCYVAFWNQNDTLARGNYLVVAPNRAAFQQSFPDPQENISSMRGFNKFGVTNQDLIGTWTTPTEGGGYNFYSAAGSWVGMSALSHGSDFIFDSSGNYRHIYTSANLNMGSSQFARIDYKGKFTVTNDWEIAATNHYNGATARFAAQIIAVRGGYLLVLTDKRSEIKYALYQKK
jgi:hypothetical protein